jgi:hypothetical protein
LLCPEDIFLVDLHGGEVNICLNMDRMSKDYCLLACDAVYDSNLFSVCIFQPGERVAVAAETLMFVVTELILVTAVDRCVFRL